MNIYLFELKGILKSGLWWTISIISALIVFMVGIYPVFQEGGKELIDLFKNFPPEFLAAFGFDIENMFGVEPFYAFSFTYIGLMSAIMAVSVSAEVFSKEKRNKCMDFILTKPVDRAIIYISKSAACLSVIVVSNIAYIICTLIIFNANTDNFKFSIEVLQLVLSPFFTQLVFMSFGMAICAIFKKIRSVSVVAASFGIIAFILSAVMNLLEKEYLNFFAPLKYFEPSYIVQEGSYDIKLTIFAVVLIVISVGFSMKKYCSEDISAV